MSTKSVLVTGGAGYIGAHTVVELAQAGFDPVIVDDLSRGSMDLVAGAEKIAGRRFKFHQVDCTDKLQLRRIFQEYPALSSIMHFAAFKSVNESVENPLLYYRNNIDSMVSLLELMREFSVFQLVFSSSCTVYGQPDKIPVTESAPFKKPESAYGATKQVCERILEDEVRARKELKAISLRYFNPIGAHPSGLIGELPIGTPNNLVPFITQTAIGKREKLTIFGSDYNTVDGTCVRDFIHVVDLAQAHVVALQKMKVLPSGVVALNLGSGKPSTVLELVNSFVRVTGVKVNYTIGPRRPGDIEKVYADPQKSFELLNWKTRLTTEDALRDAWNWEQKLAHATH